MLRKQDIWTWRTTGNELPSAFVSHGDYRDEGSKPNRSTFQYICLYHICRHSIEQSMSHDKNKLKS